LQSDWIASYNLQPGNGTGLSRGIVCMILRLSILIQYRRVTDN